MIETTVLQDVLGAKVLDSDGDKVGTVGQIYVDQSDGHALFASVNTGLFGSSESLVPIENASFDGSELHVGYDKAKIKDAPNIAADGELSADEESTLYGYYDGTGTAGFASQETTDEVAAPSGAGYDTSGPTTDEAMTRSEEQLHVGTEKVQTGKARLRKYIVTEQQTVTVPVQHEEVRLEREPITEANMGSATDGPAISEEEHEVVLTAERPVIQKETVPVERVRLGTETVTEQQAVTEDVRKEEIEFEGGDDRTV